MKKAIGALKVREKFVKSAAQSEVNSGVLEMIHVGKNPIFIYVDVDDTFVRSIGNKRIPIPAVIKQIRRLFEQNAVLYCWSSGGSEYAKQSAEEFGIADCFKDFLPKPNILIDDQPINEWRYLNHIYPAESENIILDKEN